MLFYVMLCYVMLCYMTVCKAPLTEGYSEALPALQAGENTSFQTTKRRRWYPL